MTVVAARILEHIHGHVGWLATASLLHPALLLGRAKRRAMLAACSATALATATGLLGLGLYPEYRVMIKPALFAEAPGIGWAFERKEHLAIAAIVLAWAGLGAHWAEPRANERTRAALRRTARVAYAGAAAMALTAATLGVLVAVHHGF